MQVSSIHLKKLFIADCSIKKIAVFIQAKKYKTYIFLTEIKKIRENQTND